jgi:Flp pilus assembly protein TadG
MRLLNRLLGDERASALVEFAVFLPVMTMMLLGTVDYGVLINYSETIQQAAAGAATYGAIPGNESNTSGIKAYAISLEPYLNGATASVVNFYACSPGGSSVSSTASCSGGSKPIKYLTVTTSATLPRAFAFPGLPANEMLTGAMTVRVPWTQ